MFKKIVLHRVSIISIFVFLFLSLSNPVFAGNNTWTQVGLAGETINAIAIDPKTPGTMYAGTNNGVFKSTNGGKGWTPINVGLSGIEVTHLVIDPMTSTTLYATVGTTVFKSTTSGDNWSPIYSANYTIRAFVIAPSDPTIWYLSSGQTSDGVTRITGGGSQWAYAGLYNKNVTNLVVDPTSALTVYAGTIGSGLWKTINGGGLWNAVVSLPVNYIYSLAIAPTTPLTLYTDTNQGLERSTSGGVTWDMVNSTTGFMGQPIAIDPTTPTTLYVGFYSNSIYKGTNSGANWTPFPGTDYFSQSFLSLAVDPANPDIVYGGTDSDGLYWNQPFKPTFYLPMVGR